MNDRMPESIRRAMNTPAPSVLMTPADALAAGALVAAPSPYPATPPAATRWRAEFEALDAFLQARERKMDDGDALEAYAQAEAVLTARLRISTDLDRMRESLTNRMEGLKRCGDRAGAGVIRDLLESITQKAPGL